jgi:hypothetical protein
VSTKAQTKTRKKLIKKRFGEGFFFDIPPRGNARSAQVTTPWLKQPQVVLYDMLPPPLLSKRQASNMKKIICLVICMAVLFILSSCGTKLPQGEASSIMWTNGSGISDVTFEYVNESLVKIVKRNGQVMYVPNSYIARIEVK